MLEYDASATSATPVTPVTPATTSGADAAAASQAREALQGAPTCANCGAPVVRRRVRASHDISLCLRCEQKARAAAYFRRYYAANKDQILEKNRRWAKENARALATRRRERTLSRTIETRNCVDCGAPIARAERCRRCHVRYRYATDPEFRAHRLAITRRWLEKQVAPPGGR